MSDPEGKWLINENDVETVENFISFTRIILW